MSTSARAPKETIQVMEYDFSHLSDQGREFDPHELIFDFGSTLIANARAIRAQYAVSYRKFHVGAAAISVDFRRNRAGIFVGANKKKEAHTEKLCAEMKALGEAKRRGYHYTAAIVVAGTTNQKEIRDVTGRMTPTLHPCGPCRSLIDPSTVVFSIGADENIMEVHTGEQLAELYKHPDDEGRIGYPVLTDSTFHSLSDAKQIYQDRVASVRDLPEEPLRMIRADAVVRALQIQDRIT